MKLNSISVKKSFVILLVLVLTSCKLFRHSDQRTDSDKLVSDQITLEIEGIQNVMPMTNSKPYLIITACSSEPLNENYKITELVATGANGSWKTQNFDFNEYVGKGYDQFQNVARDFDLTIGGPFEFLVTLQTESGIKTNYQVKLVKFRVVQ